MPVPRQDWSSFFPDFRLRRSILEYYDRSKRDYSTVLRGEDQQVLIEVLEGVKQECRTVACHFVPKTVVGQGDFSQIEAKIRRLVEEGNVSTARKKLSEIPVGASESLDKWKRILAEPIVKQGGPASGHGIQANLLWLERHAASYKGQWVALKRGELLGSHEDSITLETMLEASDSLTGATFFKVKE